MPEIKLTFDAANDYDRFMGRWSRAIGERFLAWFGASRAKRWLDVGCGTGAFSELILRSAAPASLTGIDPSPQQIDFVRKRLPAHTFEVADSAAMPFGDGAFDVIASALVLHFIPDRHKAFAEMKRVLSSGGLVGGYTWRRTAETDMAAYWPMMRGAEAVGGQALRSAVVPEGTQEGMRASLAAAGFTDIETTEIEVSQTYVSFDDYWEAQTRPSSPPGRTVAALDERQRTKMREQLRESMPAADGTVTYSSVAVAGRGRRA